MENQAEHEVTLLLQAWNAEDASSRERLVPLLYEQLRRLAGGLMKHERAGHTLSPTALVHEAVVRLLEGSSVSASNRSELVGLMAQLMRRVLVDYARRRKAEKRGGGATLATLDDDRAGNDESTLDLLDLDRALQRLEELDARQAKIVEMRAILGLSVDQVATLLGVSAITVKRDWRSARAWLSRELDQAPS